MELDRLENQILILKKAYETLNSALIKEILSDLEIDWVMQRFEYTTELLWKTCKIFLNYKWIDVFQSPKDIFKECYKLWLIKDLKLFFNFIEIRNSMSHMYSEYISMKSFNFIKKNYKNINELINNLETNLNN